MRPGARPAPAVQGVRWCTPVILAVLPAACLVSPLQGQTLRGYVILGSDSSGVAGAPVELHRVTRASGEVVDSATTGRAGRFDLRFAGEADPDAVYIVAARHHGVRYFGPVLHASTEVPEPYRVVVYDTVQVRAPTTLQVEFRHVVLTPLAEGGLAVEEILDLSGRPRATLVGVPATEALWTTVLPRGAVAPRVAAEGAPPEAVEASAGVLRLRSTLPPSGLRLTVGYQLPHSEYDLDLDHPTRRLEVVVTGSRVRVGSEGLDEVSAVEASDQPFRRFRGDDLPVGSRVAVRVEMAGIGRAWAWIWLALGAVFMATAVFVRRLQAHSG